MDSDHVFSLLSVKDGMTDHRYFVGRQQDVASLSGCYCLDHRSFAWIYGPKRIGKSSLARFIMKKANENNTLILWVDAIDIAPPNFTRLLERVLALAEPWTKPAGSTLKKRFEKLVGTSNLKPILMVFDEFDRVALNLRMEDQVFFRRLAQQYRGWCCLFISRLPPQCIVEEVTEANSRLLGICNQHLVRPLERRDVKDFCRRVAEDLGQKDLEGMHVDIRKAFGGFPVAVAAALKALAIAATRRENPEDELDVKEIIAESAVSVSIDLEGYWSSLNPMTRSVLLGGAESGKEQYLKDDGFYNKAEGVLRPELITQTGRKLESQDGNAPTLVRGKDHLGNAVCLIEYVEKINESMLLNHKKAAFKIVSQTLKFHILARTPCDQDTFKNAIDYLYKVFHESVRKENQYNFPEIVAKTYNDFEAIRAIKNLRNFYFHVQSKETDTDKVNEKFKNASSIFLKLCGKKELSTESDYEKARANLIVELSECLKKIYDMLTQ